eukprot:1330996-Prymnesium_polylepis.1
MGGSERIAVCAERRGARVVHGEAQTTCGRQARPRASAEFEARVATAAARRTGTRVGGDHGGAVQAVAVAGGWAARAHLPADAARQRRVVAVG